MHSTEETEMTTILVGIVMLFVGWNVPQPEFARDLTAKARARLGI
jgi:hypothetical protein